MSKKIFVSVIVQSLNAFLVNFSMLKLLPTTKINANVNFYQNLNEQNVLHGSG